MSMFTNLKELFLAWWNPVTPIPEITVTVNFDSVHKLTPETEEKMVTKLLAPQEVRALLEEYVQWKVGVLTREMLRAKDEEKRFACSERIQVLGEVTVDFQHIWNRVQRREAIRTMPPHAA